MTSSAYSTIPDSASISMEASSLELQILSCKELKQFNFFQKLAPYVVLYIDSDRGVDRKQRQEQRTQADKEGDENPEWNQDMRFDLGWVSPHDCDHLFFHFEFRHDGLFSDKLIGEVRVPLKDLILQPGPSRFLNYEVRNSEGKPNGIFNFAYRLKGTNTAFPGSDHDSRFQHPSREIQRQSSDCGISHPAATLPADHAAAVHRSLSMPSHVTPPSSADYPYYYPPVSPQYYPPPPAGPPGPPGPPYLPPAGYPYPHSPHAAYGPPYQYPPPPSPPGAYGPGGPEAHRWGPPSDPNFQHHHGWRWWLT